MYITKKKDINNFAPVVLIIISLSHWIELEQFKHSIESNDKQNKETIWMQNFDDKMFKTQHSTRRESDITCTSKCKTIHQCILTHIKLNKHNSFEEASRAHSQRNRDLHGYCAWILFMHFKNISFEMWNLLLPNTTNNNNNNNINNILKTNKYNMLSLTDRKKSSHFLILLRIYNDS